MSNIHDSKSRYGLVTRLLHWSMALLLAWQFITVIAHTALEGSGLDKFAWSTHKPMGLLLMILVSARLVWAVASLSRRPVAVSLMAKLGHLALYALMFVIPFVALLRQYGSGREFVAFGVTLMPGFSDGKISWMIEPANLLHGNLGWMLLAMIIGHVVMAFAHRRLGGEDVLARMVGR
ncbi:Cytochrome b561 [Pseudomonas sp. 8Z]|uniref:cytochrome b n=1 Tax=Pseudomonas sp. 8Z TaxID=2653166 RepID=UPI0012F3CEA4|nr:cytochrome b [Pseudomonas sp. 8Z]VXC74252.1 Cytochrome b561 [Pseudomonas sp. 8Z]